jgi:hypothetical protein
MIYKRKEQAVLLLISPNCIMIVQNASLLVQSEEIIDL